MSKRCEAHSRGKIEQRHLNQVNSVENGLMKVGPQQVLDLTQLQQSHKRDNVSLCLELLLSLCGKIHTLYTGTHKKNLGDDTSYFHCSFYWTDATVVLVLLLVINKSSSNSSMITFLPVLANNERILP